MIFILAMTIKVKSIFIKHEITFYKIKQTNFSKLKWLSLIKVKRNCVCKMTKQLRDACIRIYTGVEICIDFL